MLVMFSYDPSTRKKLMHITSLINMVSAQEREHTQTTFLAPCVVGSPIGVRVAGMVRHYTPTLETFEGWGIWQAQRVNERTQAAWVEPAPFPMVSRYLNLFESLRVWLVCPLQGQSWLAMPANLSDMQQRFGRAHPFVVRLVEHGRAFERVVARFDGGAWWAQDIDPAADPRQSASLRESLHAWTGHDEVHLKGITPELREAYRLALVEALREDEHEARRVQRRAHRAQTRAARHTQPRASTLRRDTETVRRALEHSGGRMEDVRAEDDRYWVQWRAPNGQLHSSCIARRDLTVISAGICLDGLDRTFDLQSLVGVVEDSPW